MYKTGMLCPIPGFYVFIKHVDDSLCMQKHDEIIQVEKFSRFPPAMSCGNNAFWELRREELVDLTRDKIAQKL